MLRLSIILLLIANINCAFAQEFSMHVRPAAQKVGTQDAFQVSYILQNADRVQSFRLNELKDVQMIGGPSQSNQMSIVNGSRTSSIELTYIFKAKKTGTIVLPEGIATIDGREYKTPSIHIQVIDGTVRKTPEPRRGFDPFDDPFFSQNGNDDDIFAMMQQQQQQMLQMMRQHSQMPMPRSMPPANRPQNPNPYEEFTKENLNKNLFIKVDVDKTNVTLGEQITASYKLYTRLPMEINLTKLPTLIGFWSQDFKLPQIPKPKIEKINNKEYQVFEIKKSALFPTTVGTLTLDPAEASGVARLIKPKKTQRQNPFEDDPFFSSFFSSMLMSDPDFDNGFVTTYDYEDVKVNLKSAPLHIQVRDVPQNNKPTAYDGSIGTFNIESKIDKTEFQTDDIVNLTIKISGRGNIKLIGKPQLNLQAGMELYDVEEKDSITNANNTISGYKQFTFPIAINTPGNYVLPPATFSYFDPELNEYKTLTSNEYTLHVTPGKEDKSKDNQLALKDIHDINSTPHTIKKRNKIDLIKNPFYWGGGFALPLLAYIFLIAYKRKEDSLQRNTVLFKNKKANKIAFKRLQSADVYLKKGMQNAFYEETSKAVWLYLSDKLNIPLSGLSKDVATNKLNEKHIEPDLMKEIFRITTECEMALYTPEKGSMRMLQTYMDAYKLIGKLEDKLS